MNPGIDLAGLALVENGTRKSVQAVSELPSRNWPLPGGHTASFDISPGHFVEYKTQRAVVRESFGITSRFSTVWNACLFLQERGADKYEWYGWCVRLREWYTWYMRCVGMNVVGGETGKAIADLENGVMILSPGFLFILTENQWCSLTKSSKLSLLSNWSLSLARVYIATIDHTVIWLDPADLSTVIVRVLAIKQQIQPNSTQFNPI